MTDAAPATTGRPPGPPMSVATHPGHTALTRILAGASSAARMRVSALRAAFDVLYAGVPPPSAESDPASDDTLTIRPWSLRRSSGTIAIVVRHAPKRFVSNASRTT